MRFFRLNLNTDAEYEAIRASVDSQIGYSGSLTCISPYATAPVDQKGRVLLSLTDNQAGYASLLSAFSALALVKKAKELTQDEYDASFFPAPSGVGGVSSWNDLTDKPTSFIPTAHAHGNITSAGAIGTVAGRILTTDTDGLIVTSAVGVGMVYEDGSIGPDLPYIKTQLSTVATTGAYSDLTGKPTIPSAYTLPAATVSALGGMIVGTGMSVTSGTVSVSYGTTSTTACAGNDARLSDTRTPTAHTQAFSTITATPTTLSGYGITDAATSTHTHGNLTNAGAIGSTSGQIVVTTTSGVLTTAATIAAAAVSGLAAVATSGSAADLTGTLAAARLGSHASTHQTGGTDAVSSVVVTPTSLAADTNDWAIGTGDVFRVAGTAARNITGIAAGTSGLAILLINVGSFALTIKHQSASSSSANRFTVPWAGDCVLAASGGAVVLVYDSTSSTWRVV
jgi:hypothetical protein